MSDSAGLYLGLISGTSADAIDVALAAFDPQPRLIAALAVPYPAALRPRVLALAREKAEINLDELGTLDVELGHAFADAALALLQREGLAPAAVRAIGMYLGRLRRTLILHKSGAGLPEAAKASGVFWKQEREFLRQARAWSIDTLDALAPEVLNADRACKSTGSPDALIAERLLMGIAARAKRLGL